jgi:CRP-like cAMP-binding protein
MGSCKKCIVKEFTAFQTLSSEELEEVSHHKNEMRFKRGDFIFREGTLLNGVFCVKQGKCKLTKLSANGKDQIVKFTKHGDMLGYRSVLSDEPVNLSVVALEDMQVCFIPKSDIMNSIHSNKNFSKSMFKVVCHDLKDANAKLTNMAQKKVRDRLAETLLFLDETFGEDALGYLNIRLSREEIANVVGTATESVIRMLSEMNKEQLVLLFGKKIKLLNKKRLKRIAIGF